MKYHRHPCSRSHADACRQTDRWMDGRTWRS